MADNPVLPSYIIPNQPDPAAAVRSNVELAIGLGQAQQQQQLRNLQAQELQQKITQQQTAQYQQQEFFGKMAQVAKNPTAHSIMDLMGQPGALPHYKELTERFNVLKAEEQNQIKSTLTQAFSAGDKGDYGTASKVMRNVSEAFKNVGDPQKASMYGDYADQYADPAKQGQVQTTVGMSLSALDKDFMKNFGEQKKLPGELAIQDSTRRKGESDAQYADRLNAATEKMHLGAAQASVASAGASNANATDKRVETAQRIVEGPLKIDDLTGKAKVSLAAGNEADAQQAAATKLAQANAFNAGVGTHYTKAMLDLGVDQKTAELVTARAKAAQAAAQEKNTTEKGTLENTNTRNLAPGLVPQQAADLKKTQLGNTAQELQNQYTPEMHSLAVLKAKKELGTPSAYVQKRTGELSDRVTEATKKANVADNLMERLKGATYVGGSPTAVAEYLRRHLGWQDGGSVLRKELAQFNMQEILDMMPPGGRLSEQVLEQVKKGTFDPTTNPEAMVELVRVVGLRKRGEAALATAEKQFTEVNQGTGAAKMDGKLNVNGLVVPYAKGEDLNDILTNKVMPHIPQVAGGTARPLTEDEVVKFRQAMAKHPKSAKALADTLREHGEDPNG